MSPHHLTITYEGGAPERLDKVIAGSGLDLAGATRSQISLWIERGTVSVNGKLEYRPGAKIQPGSVILFSIPTPPPSHLQPFATQLDIVFEDEFLLVINKPAHLSMHPGAGNTTETLANAVVAHVGSGQERVGPSDRPGIVHRLDKDTTGLVVIAKTTVVHAALSKQFADRTIGREYRALVFTTPRAKRVVQVQDEGVISAPIGRHPTERTKMSIVSAGRAAETRWRVIERFPYGTFVACRLKTGRTHQIRVHMDSIGAPIVGDPVYGDFSNLPRPLKDAAVLFGRQALHAAELSFLHPGTGKECRFEVGVPGDMQSLIAQFRDWSGKV